MQRTFNLPTGLAAITGAILLGLIAIPTVVSIAEDALNAVPQSYRQAALAMGATRWQTIWGITVPAAKTGILTAIMLGIGRTLGETMAVMMVTGNAAVMPEGLQSIFMPVRTMTATIASEMGEVAKGSAHYAVLFFIGIVLFHFFPDNQHPGILGEHPRTQAFGKDPFVTAFEDQSQLKGAHWQERIGDAALWVLSLITVLPILGIVIYHYLQRSSGDHLGIPHQHAHQWDA